MLLELSVKWWSLAVKSRSTSAPPSARARERKGVRRYGGGRRGLGARQSVGVPSKSVLRVGGAGRLGRAG